MTTYAVEIYHYRMCKRNADNSDVDEHDYHEHLRVTRPLDFEDFGGETISKTYKLNVIDFADHYRMIWCGEIDGENVADVLGKIFEMSNINATRFLSYENAKLLDVHQTQSVGDIIRVDGKFYRVASMGWNNVELVQ